MRTLFIDFETCSDVDLRKTGVEVYAESEHTRALCLAWAFDDGPVQGKLLRTAHKWARASNDVFDHVRAGGLVVAHNAPFELAIWRMLHRREPDVWPELRPEQLRCTAALCRAHSLPGSLDEGSRALRLTVEKDMAGRSLMLKLCKPRKPRNGEPADALYWDHHTPEALAGLLEYCKRDIEPERAIYNLLPPLSDREQAYWVLHQRINDRGIGIDAPGAELAAAATEAAKQELAGELHRITSGEVDSASAVAQLMAWFKANGFELPDMRKATVETALARKDLPGHVERVLRIRQEASRSSTAKLAAMLRGLCADGRARGLFEYHGAGTGRAAGRRIQPQNMMRPPEDFNVEDAVEVLSWLGAPRGERVVRAQYGSVISAVAWAMRSFLIAAPGWEFRAADYSNIEGRMLAWLAGEEWKLSAFREFDAGRGHDIYKLAFAGAFNVQPEDVTKPQRQIGKVQELALGYQGAHGAFLSMAKNYGIDLAELAKAVQAIVAPELWDDAVARYWEGAHETAAEALAALRIERFNAEEDPAEQLPTLFEAIQDAARKNRYGLGPDVWAAVRIIVDGWRLAHPKTCELWAKLGKAAIDAVEQPGKIMLAERIAYRMSGDFLQCRLPNGRKLIYPYARIHRETRTFKRADGSEYTKTTPKLIFEGVDSRTRKWTTEYAYGGMLAENVTQAAARDILVDGQFRLEKAGYPVVLHVHDENVCELPIGRGSLEEMCAVMAASEQWADGLPIAVAGWQGERYRK